MRLASCACPRRSLPSERAGPGARAARRVARSGARPGPSPSSRPRRLDLVRAEVLEHRVDLDEVPDDPDLGLGEQRCGLGSVHHADLVPERPRLLEQAELRARAADEDERGPHAAGAACHDSSSRRRPSSSPTSGCQPRARSRATEICGDTRPGGGSTTSISSSEAPVIVADEPGGVDQRDRVGVAADVEDAVFAGLERQADAAHDVADPAPGALLAAEDGHPLAALGLLEHRRQRALALAGLDTRAVRAREPEDQQALGRVEARNLLAPELRQRVEALRRGRRLLVRGGRRPVHVGRRDVGEPRVVRGGGARDLDRREHVRAQGELRLLLAADDADASRRVDDEIGPRLCDRALGHALVREVAVRPFEREDLVSSLPVTQLLHERAPDEARRSRDEDSHRGRVYWRACALLGSALLLAGCHGSSKKHPSPKPPPSAPKLTFRQLDSMQQRLVARLRAGQSRADRVRDRVPRQEKPAGRDPLVPASGGDGARAAEQGSGNGRNRSGQEAPDRGLGARETALEQPPGSRAYTSAWNRSVVDARRALTLMQDIRDRARLIPLPEDSIS